MKKIISNWPAALMAFAGFLTNMVHAQVPPQLLHYQGRVTENNGHFNGQGQFKFALVSGDGAVSYWSNDGQSGVNLEPTAHVQLTINQGVFSVLLGDAGTVIPYATFDHPDVRLRIWFKPANNNGPFQQFTPDRRIVSVGYAMMAASVPAGAITTDKLAASAVTGAQIADGTIGPFELGDGAITTPKLANGSVTSVKLADGAVTAGKVGPDAITGANVAANSLTSDDIAGTLRLQDLQVESAGGLDRVQLTEANNSGVLYMTHGSIGRFLEASGSTSGGFLRLYDAFGGLGLAQTTVELGSSSVGGYVRVLQDNESTGVQINGQNGDTAGGNILLYQGDGDLGVVLNGDSGGAGGVEVRSLNGFNRVRLDGSSTNDSGEISVFDDTGTETIELLGASSASSGGQFIMRGNGGLSTVRLEAENDANQGALLTLFNGSGDPTVFLNADNLDNSASLSLGNGTGQYGVFIDGGFDDAGQKSGRIQVRNSAGSTRVQIDGRGEGTGGEINVQDASGTSTVKLLGAQTSTSGGRIELNQANGNNTVILDGEVGNGGGGYLQLRNGAGTGTITLDSDFSGEGRITTQVLQITGGSDLSEQFDVRSALEAPRPGMIVCIDPKHPGELSVSARAYDRTVAGVMSGAGGVKPGMLMGQAGSKADGQHPVALTGRVYCLVNASHDAIEPGDLITTSETPGHGMKVADFTRAQGAIIGKAMTGLASGKGLVLVLVSLQ